MPEPPRAPETSATKEPQRRCPNCGYDLRHLSSLRCPECGWLIDTAVAISPIPWQHGRQLGRWRAYWRTIFLATFVPARLLQPEEAAVDYRAARSFRWLTAIVIAAAPSLVLLAAAWYFGGLGSFNPAVAIPTYAPDRGVYWLWDLLVLWLTGATLLPVLPISLVLAAGSSSAAPAIWCRPRHLPTANQNRAVALVAYGMAPLAWIALPTICLAVVVFINVDTSDPWPWLRHLLDAIWVLSSLLILFLWERNTVRLIARSTSASSRHKITIAFSLPALWLASFAIALVLFPALVGFLWLMAESLR